MMKIRVQKVGSKWEVKEKRQQVSTSLWRDEWQREPVHSWGRCTRLYSCHLMCKALSSECSKATKTILVWVLKLTKYIFVEKRESMTGPGREKAPRLRARPSERNTAWQQCFRSCRSDRVTGNPEPGPWTVPGSFILPKAPRTFRCYQPFFSMSASFYLPKLEPWQSFLSAVSIASFASARWTEKHHRFMFVPESSKDRIFSFLLP